MNIFVQTCFPYLRDSLSLEFFPGFFLLLLFFAPFYSKTTSWFLFACKWLNYLKY